MKVKDLFVQANVNNVVDIIMNKAKMNDQFFPEVERRASELFAKANAMSVKQGSLVMIGEYICGDILVARIWKPSTVNGQHALRNPTILGCYILDQGGYSDEVLAKVLRMQVIGPNVQHIGVDVLVADIVFWLTWVDYDALSEFLKNCNA